LPYHRGRMDGARGLAAYAPRPFLTSARRVGDQGADRLAGARGRRERGDAGPSPLPSAAHAAVDPTQGGPGRARPQLRTGRRRRAVPVGLGYPLAGRSRWPAQAGGRGRGAVRSHRLAAPAQSAAPACWSATMSALELRAVSRVYGEGPTEVVALSQVDLRVGDGELVAVMGPSGSGKSTLLTISGTLEQPTSGEVLIGGTAVSSLAREDIARLRRRSIGYVFQDFNLLAGLTAVENVSLPLELDGVPARTARVAGMAALEELGL